MSDIQTGPVDPSSVTAKYDARLNDPKNVFGWKTATGHPNVEGFDRDKSGRPIEHGLGSPGHETAQHYQAILKYGTAPGDQEGAQAALDAYLAGKRGKEVQDIFKAAKDAAANQEKF